MRSAVSAVSYALLAAFTAACYTIWDKQSIKTSSPLAYYAAYTVIVGVAYALLLARSTERTLNFRSHGIRDWKAITQVGALNSGSYLLTLVALARRAGELCDRHPPIEHCRRRILGWRLLGESLTAPKVDRNRAGGDRLRTPGPCPLTERRRAWRASQIAGAAPDHVRCPELEDAAASKILVSPRVLRAAPDE